MEKIIIADEATISQIIEKTVKLAIHESQSIKSAPIQEPTEYLSTNEVQRLLKISKPTLIKRMKDKTLPFVRIGRRVLFDKTVLTKSLEK